MKKSTWFWIKISLSLILNIIAIILCVIFYDWKLLLILILLFWGHNIQSRLVIKEDLRKLIKLLKEN